MPSVVIECPSEIVPDVQAKEKILAGVVQAVTAFVPGEGGKKLEHTDVEVALHPSDRVATVAIKVVSPREMYPCQGAEGETPTDDQRLGWAIGKMEIFPPGTSHLVEFVLQPS